MTDRKLLLRLSVAIAAALFLACLLGSTPMSPVRVAATLLGVGTNAESIVVFSIRLPRALAALTVGAALGASGAALQGLLRNPLAEPGVLGVSAAATLGATLSIYYGLASFTAWFVPITSVLGAVAATALIAIAAGRVRSVSTLILLGVGLSSFIAALMSLLLSLASNPFTMAEMINWTLGSVANRSHRDLLFAAPFIGGGLAILLATRRGLTVLTLGEEAASGSGLDIPKHRSLVIIGTGLATGGAVALAGAIGFVGIVAPHIIRPFVGYDPARTLVPSALTGGLLLVFADMAVRLIPTSAELKLGVLAALLGAPVFALIAFQRRGLHG